MKELTQRILVALWGIPLILGLSFFGGYSFLLLLLVINGMALWEFYSMYHYKHIYPYRVLGIVLSELVLLSMFFFPWIPLFSVLLVLLLVVLLRHLLGSRENRSLNTVFTLGGIFYITFFLGAILHLRMQFNELTGLVSEVAGGIFLVLLWVTIWICDTMAYFGGRLFGKHKLAPSTSPNKTIEGAVSGFLGAIIVFTAGGMLFLPELSFYYHLIGGILVGIFGQLGDLVESRFKRDAGVKDTSTLLPGHGGFLDRFDSFIFLSPLFYFLFYWFKF